MVVARHSHRVLARGHDLHDRRRRRWPLLSELAEAERAHCAGEAGAGDLDELDGEPGQDSKPALHVVFPRFQTIDLFSNMRLRQYLGGSKADRGESEEN
ncbi:MAG TPA: hypothetical protein VH934_12905 [Xanthobacteraceae bacterium]